MYLIKLNPEIMDGLYHLREQRKASGDRKATIAGIVREVLADYLNFQKRGSK